MSLIEEIKRDQEESFEKWFERWFEKENLEKFIKRSAMEGYTGITIPVSDREDKYIKRRLENKQVIEKLKDKLDGFDIRYKETSGDRVMLNRKVGTWYKKVISINWGVSK